MRLYRRVAEALARGEVVGLASILAVEGSAPAPEGSRLALFGDGSRIGTIGGGAPEKTVLEALAGGGEGSREFAFESGELEPGLLCGGRIRVLLEQLGAESAAAFAAIALALERGERVISGVLLADGRARARKVRAGGRDDPAGAHPLDAVLAQAAESGKPRRSMLEAGGEALAEVIAPTPRLVVVGAGHVGKAAGDVAIAAGWRLAVIDDRPEYVAATRFPAAEERIEARPGAGILRLSPGPADALLVATRSAELDLEGVLAAARSRAFYVGLLASRKKWESFRPAVVAEVGEAGADQVHAPVGLKIGAVGPGEIALAVVAEALSVWRAR